MHAQQQVLNALQTLLAAGGTVASTRVFLDRVDPLQSDELPAISIEEDAEGETAQMYTVDNLQQRDLTVTVNCILSHATTAAADARSFGLAVEKLIAPSTALAALCSLGVNITASRQINNAEGDRLFAARQQTWRFSYLGNPATPDTIV